MAISLKKIHHLIRYFVIIGIAVFVGYLKRWQDEVFLILIGPALYLAYTLKALIASLVALPESEGLNYFGFLMPFCVFYFGLLAFFLKQLWNERGKIRFISLFALIAFVLYMHYAAWGSLSAYFLPPEPPSPVSASLHPHAVPDRPLGNNQGQPPLGV